MVRISGQMQFYYVKRFENTERIRNLSQIILIYEYENPGAGPSTRTGIFI